MSIWAEGFREDSPSCKPGYKPCGFNCIKQSYNCKADDVKARRNRIRKTLSYGLMGAGLLTSGAVAAHHLRKGNKKNAARALKRLRDKALSEAAWQVGTGAAVSSAAYGLTELNRHKRKQKEKRS